MRKRIGVMLLTTLLLGASFGGFSTVGATGALTKLPSPQWSQPNVVEELESIEDRPEEVQKLNTVYLHTKENVVTQTKVWSVDTLNSYNTQTGKLKWSVNFTDPGTSMARESKPYLVSPDGTVYVTFTKNITPGATQIYAVGPDGKRKWKLNLSQEEGSLYRLSNGNLLFVSEGDRDTYGNHSNSSLTLIQKDGYKLQSVPYKGTVKAKGNRIMIQTNYGEGKGPQIEARDSSLKHVFTYKLPAKSYAEVSYNDVLSDGTVLIRVNLPKTGNRLIGFSPGGKLLWGRDIAGNAVVSSFGTIYGVYADEKLSLYTTKGVLNSVSIQDHSGFFISLYELQDGKIALDFAGSSLYVLNPETLAVEYTIKLGEEVSFSYKGNGVGYLITKKGFSRIKL